MLKIITFLYVLFLVICAMLFTLRNDAVVTIDLVAMKGQASLAFIVIGAFAVGALFGVFSMLGPQLSMRRQLRRMRRAERQQVYPTTTAALPNVSN